MHLLIQSLFVRCRVNLALAYTELTEELGRVRSLAVKQSDLLRHVSRDPGRSLVSGRNGIYGHLKSVGNY